VDWATLLNDYGFPTVLFLLLASHAKGILAFAERMLSKAWPTFAEQRRLKLERATVADERVDTILALKDMLCIVRESLRDERLERRLDKEKLYKIIERHEQLDARIVEALRDISEVMRNVSRVLGRIAVRVGVYNDADKKVGHDKS
jgi:hypothetical protein